MARTTRDIRALLHHRLMPALPVPFTNERIIHHDSHVRIAEYMVDMPISGVAVWAHTGRGLYLSEEERAEVLTHWREALPDHVIVAGAGCSSVQPLLKNEGAGGGLSASSLTDDDYIKQAREMAVHAKSLGADAILCYAPTRFRDRSAKEQHDAVVEYHRQIASAGLPIILFYLYEAAGGISYSRELLGDLFSIPNVLGVKMATLDSVMTFQDVAAAIKSDHPDQLLITGEDRFLGYSLMMGADAALIGMGAALTSLQADMMTAYYQENTEDFVFRSSRIDRFAETTFVKPMEGYIARMLFTLSALGIVSGEAVYDPWGPEISEAEFDAVGDFLASLPTELKR